MKRRAFLASATAIPLSVVLGKSGFAAGLSGQLTIASYGGTYQEAQNQGLLAGFVAANPDVSILHDTTVSDAKVRAMVESGQVTWDIAVLSDNFGFDDDGDWLEPIDFNIIPRDRFLDGMATNHRVGAAVEAAVITYRSDIFVDGPQTFADFFDLEKFPGARAVYRFVASGIIEGALLADGVPADQLYPIDMERALRKLDTIKDQIIWWESGAQSAQLLASGEAPMGLLWIGRTIAAAAEAPVVPAWGQWIPTNAYWAVPKGAPNRELAMQAIAAFTEDAPQREFSRLIPYGPTNRNVALDDSFPFAGNYPTDHLPNAVPMDYRWWRDNREEMDGLFQQWLIS